MSKKEKLLSKLCATPSPKDFRWSELITLMTHFNFKHSCGATSHYTFEHTSGFTFGVSKTHPSGILKSYQIIDVKDALTKVGAIK